MCALAAPVEMRARSFGTEVPQDDFIDGREMYRGLTTVQGEAGAWGEIDTLLDPI
jgi:hypothetical protein